MSETEESSSHLVRGQREIVWDWEGEDPVEIILVCFVLVLFFTLPRGGCGIDKSTKQLSGPDQGAETAQKRGGRGG